MQARLLKLTSQLCVFCVFCGKIMSNTTTTNKVLVFQDEGNLENDPVFLDVAV